MNNVVTYSRKEPDVLYIGLLAYIFIFYTQIHDRISVLGALRLEFVVGSVLVLMSLARILGSHADGPEKRTNLAALLFLFAVALTVPFAFVRSRALEFFIHLLKFSAIYLMIIAAVTDERKLKGFLYFYIVLNAFIFVEPFLLSLQGKGFIYNNYMMRLGGTTHYFGHPNHLGSLTAAHLPFFYCLFLYERSKFGKMTYLALIMISLRVIMLTMSRTAYIGVIATAVMVWLDSRKKIRTAMLVFASLAVVWIMAPAETKGRFLSMSSAKQVISVDASDSDDENARALGSMLSRWELIRHGFIMFLENPIIGVGPGCYNSVSFYKWNYWFPPHNTYIQALTEVGLIGTAAFLFLIVTTIRNLKHAQALLTKDRERRPFLWYLTKAAYMYLWVQLVVSMFGQDLYNNYWWIMGGLSLVLVRIASKDRSLETTPSYDPATNNRQMTASSHAGSVA